jgi:hypothetical protein
MEPLHGIIIHSLRIELIERSVFNIHSDSWIFCLIISPVVLLGPLVGLRPPSKIPAFCHSASLCLVHLSLFCPRHNARRRSLFMRVLSHSDTQYLNRHTAWCGCHEILIERCITVLFLLNFSLYSIQI